jgi:HORMA domain
MLHQGQLVMLVGLGERSILLTNGDRDAEPITEKTEKEIQDEIQAIFRQITASVTFLPMLDGNCTFNVLVYADADSEVPMEWGDSDAKEIENGEKVQLRSFSTSNHRVDTLVSYRYDRRRSPCSRRESLNLTFMTDLLPTRFSTARFFVW